MFTKENMVRQTRKEGGTCLDGFFCFVQSVFIRSLSNLDGHGCVHPSDMTYYCLTTDHDCRVLSFYFWSRPSYRRFLGRGEIIIYVVGSPSLIDGDDDGVWQILTLRRLMSYMYGAPILDVSRSHTTTQHSR